MTTPTEVALHVRSLSGGDGRCQAHVVEQLQDLAGETVEAVTVDVWGESVALDTAAAETRRGREILGLVADCRAWADRAGVSLSPFFETRERTTRLREERYTAMRLPIRALVERRDGEITHVTPHDAPGGTVTVDDRLSELAGGAAGTRETVTP
jgi:hypothetical protein